MTSKRDLASTTPTRGVSYSMNAPTSWIRNPAIRSPRPNAETPARARLQINKSIPETRTVSPIKFIKIGQVMSQVRLQPTSLWRDSFYDSRHGDGTDLTGKSEKQSRILHFTGNFYYAFIAAVFGTVGDETVFKNLVLVRRRVTERQEAVIVIDRYFDNHLSWPSLVGGAEYHKWKSLVISGRSLAD